MSFDPVFQILTVTAVMSAAMFCLWGLQYRTRDAGLVDVGWSLGIGLAAIFYAWSSEGLLFRRWLLVFFAGAWSFRLAFYLLFDRVLKGGEDSRYRSLRHSWGDRAQLYFLLFFQFQAVLVALFSIPLLIAARNPSSLHWSDVIAFLIWLTSLAGESIADRQLARFRSQPENRGKTCREGLWRYSRHPNYFFEWLHWWTYVFLGFGHPWFLATLVGPIVMLFFLFKVTGIPANEARALESRGEDYRRYQKTTNQFFPWFPKENPS